ncbi:MAG TPA: DNA methyltransferase [Burkholderiales bacterium]|nr:DNA methyltransferase [Burkholderiales bacterium]
MTDSDDLRDGSFVDFDASAEMSPAFLKALHSTKNVTGLTHNHYRYPARFAPEFVREAIATFSKPGNIVLDPFMGGGTCAVEALAAGRKFLGIDINQLAHFVSRVKTTVLTTRDEAAVLGWVTGLTHAIHVFAKEEEDLSALPYQKHIPWWLKSIIRQAIDSLELLGNSTQRNFARCSILRTAQWALDCRKRFPDKKEFLAKHHDVVVQMILGSQEFSEKFLEHFGVGPTSSKNRRLICADTAHLGKMSRGNAFGTPDLVVTSPPYLGVHVLYHRWQVQGRRETGAPYWIAGKQDNHSGIFYTFADRRSARADQYLTRLRACLQPVVSLMSAKTFFVQLVAFRDPDIQLPLYQSALRDIGLEPCESVAPSAIDRNPSRAVPNRRWYAILGKQSKSSEEFLLVHRRTRSR